MCNAFKKWQHDKADEDIEELLKRYKIPLEISMRCSSFIFDCVHLLYYKCHKKSFKKSGSNIDSPDWIKNKKATINPINKRSHSIMKK